ncbi:FkbM family methyltransferase [Synechococcus sp. CS-1328]|uniref:FkbM family methyltransferase n=1 Tax=Synechococcus sp. CS-1328 TaxID=2847976 RepID=UPI00223AF25F|nr:FkbM family methyltransferase [Synechococcus sp. CS-1328]MCT0225903.1 FkbM family methyltransferase [Synechococcus sp. CS-1328]
MKPVHACDHTAILAQGGGVFQSLPNANSATNSLLLAHVNGPIVWGEGLLDLKCIQNCGFKTLDCVLQELSIPSIDILKLDVQGAEPLVLKGALGACAKRSIEIVYTEIILQDTYVGQKRFEEVLSYFHDAGFSLYNVYNLISSPNGSLCQLDAVFTRKEPDSFSATCG